MFAHRLANDPNPIALASRELKRQKLLRSPEYRKLKAKLLDDC